MKFFIYCLFIIIICATLIGVAVYTKTSESEEALSGCIELSEKNYVKVPELWPASDFQKISSPFGMRLHPVLRKRRMHWGVDFPLPEGTHIRATAPGKVKKTAEQDGTSSYGIYVQIEHDSIYTTLYAHLSEVFVTSDQWVQIGDTIGLSGNTGLTNGPHLHYEVFENGKRVNPHKFLPIEQIVEGL
ncbi:MAG: M23 family metallopeptidase [Bacteroidetes bacterium]|nr:M23 family metallopeptidase [Bacteroidota bacterium]MCB0842213.1 M23 family metallopeptidase [Bacteroidota bacterium]